MTTFYFIGGEDHDFTKIGNVGVNTATTAARRTANARCTLQILSNPNMTDGWSASFDASRSSFWFTARFYPVFNQSGGFGSIFDFLAFTVGGVRRLGIDYATQDSRYRLFKQNTAGSRTVLVSGSAFQTSGVLQKLDIQVNYSAAGSVNVYLDGTLIISYSGDVTTDSATGLSGAVLGACAFPMSGGANHWSEVICADTDTRGLSLVTLAPNGNGNTFSFDSGSYTSINETTLDDTTLISSGTAGQLAQFTIGSAGITGNPGIKALAVTARAAKGGTGPQNAKASARTGGANYASAAIALPAALGRIQGVFTTNPATAAPWSASDLTAAGLNIGIQSDT